MGAAKVIFRRIAGRIVPFKAAAGFTPHAIISSTSAALKGALKEKIASRTSLTEKRFNAVRTVREFIKDHASADPDAWYLGKGAHFNRLGSGMSAQAWQKTGTTTIVKHGSSAQMEIRAAHKAVLSKAGIAPETFHVQTSKRDFLIQKTLPGKVESSLFRGTAQSAKVDKFDAQMERMMKKAARRHIMTLDLSPENLGKTQSGKLQLLDSGQFERMMPLKASDIKRISKFSIKLPKGNK